MDAAADVNMFFRLTGVGDLEVERKNGGELHVIDLSTKFNGVLSTDFA